MRTRVTDAPLTLQNVTVAYGDRVAMRDVSATFAPGSLIGILGPNGAGKSTLFRAVLGLVPYRGTVTFAERPSYVPQGEGFDPDFPATAFDVALMGRYGHRRWWQRLNAEDRAVARRGLQAMDMDRHADCAFGTLSGGQRQRAIIARALTQERRVLLLDEPMTGVDTTSATIIEEALLRLRDEGRTILMSTHDISAAARLCDRLILMNGRITADGAPGDVLVPGVLRDTYGDAMLTVGTNGDAVGLIDDAHHGCGDDHGHDHAHPDHDHSEHHAHHASGAS